MNRTGWLGALLAGLLALPMGAAGEMDEEEGELIFGSVAMDIPARMLSRLEPVTDYLSAELGMEVGLRLSPNMPDAIREVAEGRSDIAYLTPVAYIRARDRGQVEPLVRTVTKGEEAFRLMLVVREDSPLETPQGLVGKRFAFGDEAALLQRATVVNAGVTLDELGEYHFLGHYDNIVRGVINGDFDAGILKDTTAYEWEGNGIRILHESPLLPPYVIAARDGLDPALRERIREVLLAARADDPASGPALRALDESYDGFAPVSDADYDVIRELIAPFD
ncbi:phosphonate ABC transporter, periplasmic phosphonate-binding protein [Thioalkalivibrio sp. K90mix]|uniref:PhnD/SsuA/transferrin family substrate-binding protein n=1 Tax=unclassified Thioalkalivibrio TaxID=2621013 RepID=UPI000195A6E9|nr:MULTISPECIES: PhnD/SsuA/transferrin family substrate-binding protein [unclassified Thioalkalivibrio]ADC70616.1 phosphonate ABC transporter, periplasmic phosphonate-binding protein [Thioalkalivibrio sp. K90mix]